MADNQKTNPTASKIIVNADDFGLNERNSKAIAEAFDKGLITDTTVLANGEYLDEALTLAREKGFFKKLGVHLNLTEGEPLTEDIKGCPRFVTDGRFNKVYNQNRTSPLKKAEKAAIEKELDAQISRLEAAGVKLTHADSHHHIHTAVFVAPIAERVCKAHGINKMRLHRNLGNINAVKRFVKKKHNRRLRKQGFITTDYFAYVMDIRDSEIPDNTEIMVHPDFDKDGVLIDRRGMENGFPIGYPLPDFRKDDAKLKGYAEL